MTDSESSQPQDDSDEDIYKDIPEFNLEDELAKIEGSKETYKQEAHDLSEKVKALTQENKELKKLNEVLKRNLSTLLKTAQAEVHRKDSMIEELRSKVESFTFRRCKKSTSEKSTNTDDLIFNLSGKQESKSKKNDSEKIRSRSYENWTSSDGEWRCNQEDDKKTSLHPGREENSNCDEKKSGYYRENAQNSKFGHSESNRDSRNEKRKDRKSTKYEDSSDHRRPFRENHRDHLLNDAYDKKRHSRSSDNRFLSRRRSSRERRRDRRRSDSRDRRKRGHRRDDSPERSRKQGSTKEKSRSWGSKESSLEKPKSRSSLDKDLVVRTKEGFVTKADISKGAGDGVENKERVENCGKKRNSGESVFDNEKNNQNKDKCSDKSDKRKSLEMFSTKSPLDTLYKDMIASRSFSQFSNSKGGTTRSESDLEEGELFVTGNESQNTDQTEEDWTLSFKNERPHEAKPMTLYSRRMMQKFSSELKEKQLKRSKEEKKVKEKTEQTAESNSLEKVIEAEKEPGELTDDENVIESSREFQELTKVAALESEIIKKPPTECSKDTVAVADATKTEPEDSQQELEKIFSGKEESAGYKEAEPRNETCEVIEFSPFKNNYKLIEISPIKPIGNGHVLDFYNKKMPPTDLPEQKKTVDSSEQNIVPSTTVTSGEKNSLRNPSENNLGRELRIVIPPTGRNANEDEKESEKSRAKEKEPQRKEESDLKKKEKEIKKREKKSKASKEESTLRRAKRSGLKKGTEKLVLDERTEKRKRKYSEETEVKSDPKKLKLEKNEELPRKSLRSKRNSKSEPEGQNVQETESMLKQEPEDKLNDDTSACEVTKPVVRADAPETPLDVTIGKCPATDYKMTATMSVTGVVRLETPNKCIGNLKNLMINEQMIFNILDSKSNSQFSPLIGSKSIEMTPRRMLKNDLMLTDSEDDSGNKQNGLREDVDEVEERMEEEQEGFCGSEYSDSGSDSGASDFVDLL